MRSSLGCDTAYYMYTALTANNAASDAIGNALVDYSGLFCRQVTRLLVKRNLLNPAYESIVMHKWGTSANPESALPGIVLTQHSRG